MTFSFTLLLISYYGGKSTIVYIDKEKMLKEKIRQLGMGYLFLKINNKNKNKLELKNKINVLK